MPGPPGPSVKCPCNRTSAFTAKLSDKLPSPLKPVTFTEVLYNAQRDLQEDTGVFTGRVPGNSHFLSDVELQHCKVIVRLMRNKSSVLEKHQVSAKESSNLSGMLSLPLSVGKKVWLEAEAETKKPEQSHSYNLFLWSPDIVLASLYSEDKPLMILLSKANRQINKYALYLGLLGFLSLAFWKFCTFYVYMKEQVDLVTVELGLRVLFQKS